MTEAVRAAAPNAPLRIRGHHFWAVLESCGFGSPESYMHKGRFIAEAARQDATSETIDLSILDTSDGSNFETLEHQQAYAVDLLGDTDASAATFESSGTAFLRAFHSLKPEDTVVVGVGILDGMCDGCAFKRHCNNTNEASLEPDYIYMKAIHQAAEHLGMATQAVITGDESDLRSLQMTTTGAVMHGIVNALLSVDQYDPMKPFVRGAQDGFAEVFSVSGS